MGVGDNTLDRHIKWVCPSAAHDQPYRGTKLLKITFLGSGISHNNRVPSMQMPWVGAQAKIPALQKQVDELKYILSYTVTSRTTLSM